MHANTAGDSNEGLCACKWEAPAWVIALINHSVLPNVLQRERERKRETRRVRERKWVRDKTDKYKTERKNTQKNWYRPEDRKRKAERGTEKKVMKALPACLWLTSSACVYHLACWYCRNSCHLSPIRKEDEWTNVRICQVIRRTEKSASLVYNEYCYGIINSLCSPNTISFFNPQANNEKINVSSRNS